ncbi:MAG TPA: BadF/BadG/BcrA/BcrD ATPase family protein, partial [Spirochaetota bacterium]|nr:BadF/BadG/BcrA/BcrD ATPase family protein [Spirochaetota bacterium]
MHSLGINIGSSSIKLVLMNDKQVSLFKTVEHEGDFINTLKNIFRDTDIPAGTRMLVTGTEGRYLINANNVIESICVEEALRDLGIEADAVVSLGGENFLVYSINNEGKIITSLSGNKCASGTGEFFKQQLGRMDMTLADVANVPDSARVHHLSARCSVFMKSDCTHKLNKGEATKYDIVLSLSDVMATKVADFLKRAKIRDGRVILTGGVTNNAYIVKYIQDKLPGIKIIIPDEATYFEAYGAALLAVSSGSPVPDAENLFKTGSSGFGKYASLKSALGRVTYIEPLRAKVRPGGEYILGIDGGSTTTKVALIDIETDEIVADYYGRTHGDPVNALKTCIYEVKKQVREQIGDAPISISVAATTGSSREILGVFMETGAVYNEIIAHATGTTYFKSDIDTIFEIGGQDAKYVHLKNKVPIDYAMNEACSAGTGSFLEESAAGDLNITDVRQIGDIA